MTDAQREERVRTLLPLVRRLARRLKRMVHAFDLDDLVGDGSLGLLRAVDTFDPQRGPSLEEYARQLIVGAMLNGIRRMDPVSERSRRIVRDGDGRRYALAASLGAVPTLEEMEQRCPGYRRALAAAHCGQPLSLDSPLPLGESLVNDWSGDPAAIVERKLESAALHALVDALPRRQRDVVLLHYYSQASLRRIGKRLAISPQRASQLHLAALAKLRRNAVAAPG